MKALIVDDDQVLADVVAFMLRREGFEVLLAYHGEMALQRWAAEQPDLIILDVNLPRLDGFSVCQRIRLQADTPIILLTVRGEEEDIVKGLNLGADDYVTKPFSPRQLMARIQAVLRRAVQAPSGSQQQIGDLTFDPSFRALTIGANKTIALTPLEGRLISYLILNANHIVPADSLIDHIWGPAGGDHEMLRQLVHRLRSKIEPDPSHPYYIETVAGLGYGLMTDAPNY